MVDDSDSEADATSGSTSMQPESILHNGAFFPSSQQFVVAGGTFTSVGNVNLTTPTPPPVFRTIPFGDLDLRSEIRLDSESGVVCLQRGRRSVRRMYSARVHGLSSSVVVALYQGAKAEEVWKRDIARYSALRHPNFLQLYGISKSCPLYATVFHGDLMPVEHVVDMYRHSHILTTYIYACLDSEFLGAAMYFQHQVSGKYLDPYLCTSWIRPSTGRLIVDIAPLNTDNSVRLYGLFDGLRRSITSFLEPHQESTAIFSLTLDQYHEICHLHLSQTRRLPISAHATVHLGQIISCSPGSRFEDSDSIAYPHECYLSDWGWDSGGNRMSNGWTRFQACNVLPGELISREIHFDHFTTWLVQANHIFHRVQIKSNRENCLFMHSVQYQLAFSPTGRDPPAGYLFVCPMDRTEIHNGTRLRFPDHPAYWSLNPSGREHLSAEEARCLGFPHIELTVLAFGRSWDDNVYAGLSQFHRGKGFNPDSQDIARHLRYPLYLLSEDAHSTEEATGNGDDLPASNAPVFAVDREIFEFLPEDCSDLTEFPTPTHEGDTRIYRLYAAEIFPPSHDWKIVTGVKFGLILGLSLIQLKNCVHVAFPYIPPWTIETAVLGALAAGILLVCRAPLAKQTQNEQAPPKGLCT